MAIVIGLDIGTSTITAVAVDEGGGVCASSSHQNSAGPSARLVRLLAGKALVDIARRLGNDRTRIVGLAVTGQQHGGLLVDAQLRPKTRFVNWQDRRGDEMMPGGDRSYAEEVAAQAGPDLVERAGCRLASGYLGTTLFRWRQHCKLREDRRACFISDFVAAQLTGAGPVTDPTLAASSGLFDLRAGDWDWDAIHALDLPASLFAPVRPAGTLLGTLRHSLIFGSQSGVPVFVGLGDHQASFLGAVADPENSLFINVGTGGQVAAYINEFQYDPALETRPFPGGGFELVAAGLTGGQAYATLEAFFRRVGADLFGDEPTSLFARLNQLAAEVPPGADDLVCVPFFTGVRQEPHRRAAWLGMTERNFTPGHMARAVLEGMARVMQESAERIERLAGKRSIVIAAGNGVRENPLFASILAAKLGRPVRIPHHREEAAYGAAIVAAVGAGLLPDFAVAGRWIRYDG
jgi:sugar (pentulose or hexulose) kinase